MFRDGSFLRQMLVGLGVLAILIVVFAIARPHTFLTANNLKTVLELSARPAIFAIAVTFVLIAGEFDLSFGAVASVVPAIAITLIAHHGWNIWISIVVGLGIGALFGLVNGLAVRLLHLPSFVATLATTSIAAAIELATTNSQAIYSGIPNSFTSISNHVLLFGLNNFFYIAVVVAVIAYIVTRKTVFGRHLEAIGENREASELAGIPVTRILVIAFVITATVAALCGVLLTSNATEYYPSAAVGDLLPSYTAAFVGIIYDRLGRFNIIGSVLGVLTLQVLTDGLTVWNQPAWLASLIQGLVLIFAVAFFQFRSRHAAS